jgi:hypothetical protein
MRFFIGSVLALALGVAVLGCNESEGIPCDPDPYPGGCPERECSFASCNWWNETCSYSDSIADGHFCALADGATGVRSGGECGEDPCQDIVCDDSDLCTDDSCDSLTGECVFTAKECDDGDDCTIDSCDAGSGECDFTVLAEDGTGCRGVFAFLGMCEAGLCVEPCDWAGTYECPIQGLEDLLCCPGTQSCKGEC